MSPPSGPGPGTPLLSVFLLGCGQGGVPDPLLPLVAHSFALTATPVLSAATCFIDVRSGPGQARSEVTGVAALSAAAHAVGVRLTIGLRCPGHRQGCERLKRGMPSRT